MLPESKRSGAFRVNNLLFATDFSPVSDAASLYAAAIARHFGATVHAAHVISETALLTTGAGVDYYSMGTLYEDAHDQAKEKLSQACVSLVGIPHQCYVGFGQVWRNLAAISVRKQIDLIIVGTHGRTGLGKLLLGSVAEDILRHAPCPVLTIGPEVMRRDEALCESVHSNHELVSFDPKRILYATNFGYDSARMAVALSLADEFQAKLTLMHAIENHTERSRQSEVISEGMRRLRELIPADAALKCQPETMIQFGRVAERILRVASERAADLIVLGTRTSLEPGETHLPWSTAHHVLAHAPCPVLTVRG